jgi:hypothetical protein
LAHGSSTTGYPQFQFKAGGAESVYVDEIQILNATPALVQARSNTQYHYLYGQFTSGNDTTLAVWGQQVYNVPNNFPDISLNNGLEIDFAGASTTSQVGIKWTAATTNAYQGTVITPQVNVGSEVGTRLSFSKEYGAFTTIGIVLAAAYGVQDNGQTSPLIQVLVAAEVGTLVNGTIRAIGTAIVPYYQFQFGVRSDAPGTLILNDVDLDYDQDDPNFGDPTLYP